MPARIKENSLTSRIKRLFISSTSDRSLSCQDVFEYFRLENISTHGKPDISEDPDSDKSDIYSYSSISSIISKLVKSGYLTVNNNFKSRKGGKIYELNHEKHIN